MPQRLLVLLFLLVCLATPTMAEPFTFATPERTWATLKFALDTRDSELFLSCLVEEERPGYAKPGEFEKFLEGAGRFAQTSRVVEVAIEGEQAVLRVDFYCLERSGKLLIDNDPVRLRRVDGRWLLRFGY